MRNFYFPFFILALVLCISWLNYRLSVRWIPQFRLRAVKYAFWLLTAAACLIIAYSWSTRLMTGYVVPDWLRYAGYGAFAWIIAQAFFLITLPLLYALQRLVAPAPQPQTEPDSGPVADNVITRRDFLQNSLIGLPAMAAGVSAFGVQAAVSSLEVMRHTLHLPGLPPELNGLRILQISDTHIGPYFPLNMLDRLIAAVKKEEPDIAVITGDMIDDLELLSPSMERLSALAPHVKHGLYYCWGNHEYFRNINQIYTALRQTPIKILDNSSYPVIPGKTPFYLLGVDYPWGNTAAAQAEKRRQFMAKTLATAPAESFKVLLSHHPDFITDAFAAGIPLTLTGHTHGGQLVLFGKPLLPLRYTYMRGLYKQNDSYGYVNSGAGHWFPFRLGCPPEIAVFTLKPLS
jgi:hypothetical protein